MTKNQTYMGLPLIAWQRALKETPEYEGELTEEQATDVAVKMLNWGFDAYWDYRLASHYLDLLRRARKAIEDTDPIAKEIILAKQQLSVH